MDENRRYGVESTSTSKRLDGKHKRRPLALITGATSGIGLAIAHDLSQDHDLILLARNHKDLHELADVLTEESRAKIRTVAVDLTNDAALSQAIKQLKLSGLNVLVNCAGVEAHGSVETLDPEQWRQVLNLNVIAVGHLTSLVLPPLRKERGLVVMMNSGAGLHTWPQQSLYCASKYALKALADALRAEEYGRVRVTTIYPGRVDTPMQRRIQKKQGAKYRAKDHVAPASVANMVRSVINTPLDAVVEELSIRPGGML